MPTSGGGRSSLPPRYRPPSASRATLGPVRVRGGTRAPPNAPGTRRWRHRGGRGGRGRGRPSLASGRDPPRRHRTHGEPARRPLFTDVDLTLSTRRPAGGRGAQRLRQVDAAAGAHRRGRAGRRARSAAAAAPGWCPSTRPGGADAASTPRRAPRSTRGRWLGGRGGGRPPRARRPARPADGSSSRAARPPASRLARALAEVGRPGDDDDSVVLVLDEPTNHLDIDAIAWLEERLAAHRGGLVLVTHDRHVLDRVTTRILELDRGTGPRPRGRLRLLPRRRAARAEQAESAETGPAQPGQARAGVAASGRPGAHDQGQGPRRPRDRAGRGTPRGPARPSRSTCPMRRGRLDPASGAPGYAASAVRERFGMPRLGDQVIELERRGPPLRRGRVAVPRRRAATRTGERIGMLGSQRRREVDAARRSWPASFDPPRAR